VAVTESDPAGRVPTQVATADVTPLTAMLWHPDRADPLTSKDTVPAPRGFVALASGLVMVAPMDSVEDDDPRAVALTTVVVG
jgi:hypothetical protein